MTHILEDTKERALPGHPAQTREDYLVYLKHVALYDFAEFCLRKTQERKIKKAAAWSGDRFQPHEIFGKRFQGF